MPITQNVYSVGTALQQIVAPTVDAERVIIQNQEPGTNVGELSKEGYVFLSQQYFPLPQSQTRQFRMITGPLGAQIEFYEIVSDQGNIRSELIEGATITSAGTAFTAKNLNRNVSDVHAAQLDGFVTSTGGSAIAQEFVTASKAAGGITGSSRIHTLRPNTTYVLSFQNVDNKDLTVFFTLGFAEQYNGYTDVWLGEDQNSVRLRGGESIQMSLFPEESINASTHGTTVQVATLRQD